MYKRPSHHVKRKSQEWRGMEMESSSVLEHMYKRPGHHVKRKSEEWRGGFYRFLWEDWMCVSYLIFLLLCFHFRTICNEYRRWDTAGYQWLQTRQKWIWKGQELELKKWQPILRWYIYCPSIQIKLKTNTENTLVMTNLAI